MIDYKEAGVDIEKGDELVERIKKKVKSTYGNRVLEGVGGFACLYDMGEKVLAAGTDGVGTKLKIANILNKHDTIGIDLVAMCVNDILCTGAKPLFFMDYLATGKLDVDVSEQVIEGIVRGCNQSHAALIGGETAEMPGMYADGDYDLAGFAVGEIKKEDVIDGKKINEGDTIIGISSNGIHSNGYSLVRKLINEDETDLLNECLTPTRIYEDIIRPLVDKKLVSGLAHITGGGLTNISRLNKNFDYKIERLPEEDMIPPIFSVLRKRSELPQNELYRTFNMGMGMVVITSRPEEVKTYLKSIAERFFEIGLVTNGSGNVVMPNGSILS